MGENTDFRSQFYNIQGVHINERKKNFYKLLHSTQIDLPDEQIAIEPRNYLEELFYVDVLIHFRKFDKLTDILKYGKMWFPVGQEILYILYFSFINGLRATADILGNEVFASKILKLKWFFKEKFNEMDPDEIVNVFLPSLPHGLKIKVLKKIPYYLDEEKIDQIFDLVLARYGLHIAQKLLFNCSKEKFTKIIRQYDIILKLGLFKRIFQKDPNRIKLYLEEYKNSKGCDFSNHDCLEYIPWKCPNLYFEWELDKLDVKLGRRTSKSALKMNKDRILKDIKLMQPRVNNYELTRRVENFDQEYLPRFFSLNLFDIKHDLHVLHTLVIKYPRKKQWDVLSKAFKIAYNTEIINHLDYMDQKWIKIFPEAIKYKWAEILFSRTEDSMYIEHLELDKAFDTVKNLINVTSNASQRGTYIEQLTRACHHKKQSSLCHKILEFIYNRTRNDHVVNVTFLKELLSSTRNDDSNALYWEFIKKNIDLKIIQGNVPYLNMGYYIFAISQYLICHYQTLTATDSILTFYIKDKLKHIDSFNLDERDNPKAESTVLKLIFKIVLDMPLLENENKIKNRIFSDIIDFNTITKEHKIDLEEYPTLISYIKECIFPTDKSRQLDEKVFKHVLSYNVTNLNKPLKICEENDLFNIIKSFCNDYDILVYINSMLLRKSLKRSDFENNLLDLYFTRCEDSYYQTQAVIQHFFKYEPKVIQKYFNEILKINCRHKILDYNLIKLYSHLNLDQKLILRYKPLISLENQNEINLFTPLSIVMKTEDFLNSITDYIPVHKRGRSDNTEEAEKYQKQCKLAKSFRNLEEPNKVIPILMEFCHGDYLQSSLSGLRKILNRSNEESALSVINTLSQRAVSTRKHCFHLAFVYLPVENAVKVCSSLIKNEENDSSKDQFLSVILKFFIQTCNESIFDVILQYLHIAKKVNTELKQLLVNSFERISKKYHPMYIENLFRLMENIEKQQDANVTEYKATIIQQATSLQSDFFKRINKDFCHEIIGEYFLKYPLPKSNRSFSKLQLNLFSFTLKYLEIYNDFDFVFNKINCCFKANGKNTEFLKDFKRFFTESIRILIKKPKSFVDLYESHWKSLFRYTEFYSETFYLQLIRLYKEYDSLETFSHQVNDLLHKTVETDGPFVVSFLLEPIKTFFSIISSENESFKLAHFALFLMKSNSTSSLNCFIAYSCISGSEGDAEILSNFKRILEENNSTYFMICNNKIAESL